MERKVVSRNRDTACCCGCFYRGGREAILIVEVLNKLHKLIEVKSQQMRI